MFTVLKNSFAIVTISLVAFTAPSAMGQEISEQHLKSARQAITATKATESFDSILLNASAGLKNQLTANDPDKAATIATVVDEEAIALAARRADLENEAARLFANTFSEEELGQITQFFNSPAGAKYLNSTPILARELGKAARVWANGISRDLNKNVTEKLKPSGN